MIDCGSEQVWQQGPVWEEVWLRGLQRPERTPVAVPVSNDGKLLKPYRLPAPLRALEPKFTRWDGGRWRTLAYQWFTSNWSGEDW